jgi:Ser/Thr protein kinase RdoA (MazF antagonist)
MRAVIERLEQLLGGVVTLEQLKHKPGRRRTLRARARGHSAIVKLYASERAGIVAARVGTLAAGPREPRMPRVLLADPELHMVVLSEVPGVPLREALIARDLASCRRAGAALGAWHRTWSSTRPRPLRAHTPERELETLWDRSEAAPAALGAAIRRAARGLDGPWPTRGVVHRDLYEEQILLGDSVGLIDLDDAALGPPELDLGNLLGHLELLEHRTRTHLSTPIAALLAGYAATGPDLDPDLLERCHRLTLLRLACIHHETTLVGAAVRDYPGSIATGASPE